MQKYRREKNTFSSLSLLMPTLESFFCFYQKKKKSFCFLNHCCFSSGHLVYGIMLSGLLSAECSSLHLLCLTYPCMCTGQMDLRRVGILGCQWEILFTVSAVRFSMKFEMLLKIISNCGDLGIWTASEILTSCIVAVNINLKKKKRIPAYTVTRSSDRYSVAGLRYYFESLLQQL